MLTLPIIDAHHHLWFDPPPLGGRAERRYMATDLLADVSDVSDVHEIVGTVYVECGSSYRPHGPKSLRPVGETEFAISQAHSVPIAGACAGIVGFADLLLGDAVRAVLDAHLEAGHGRFRGIRHSAATDDDPVFDRLNRRTPAGLLADSHFRAGFAQLASLSLTFDAMVFHTQLDELGDLARAFPQTTIIVNHLGGMIGIGDYASRRVQSLAILKSGIRALSRYPNVAMKIGGLGMFLGGSPLLMREPMASIEQIADEWRPLVAFAIDCFSPNRCLFESNFPVDSSMCTYRRLWDVFKALASSYSESERRMLFAGSAASVYRLQHLLEAPLRSSRSSAERGCQ